MPGIIEAQASAAEILNHLLNRLLGELPAEEKENWWRRFERAGSEGADLSGVVSRFMIALLTDPKYGAARYAAAHPGVERAIHSVAGLYGRALSGNRPTAAEWAEAAKAADAASMVAAVAASWAVVPETKAAAWAAAASAWAAARTAVDAASCAQETAWTAEASAWAAAAGARAKEEPARAAAARAEHSGWQVGVLFDLLSEVLVVALPDDDTQPPPQGA